MTLKDKIKCIIEDEINGSELDREDGTLNVDWDVILEKAHEEVHTFLKEQITDAEDHEWLYNISELVSLNEACRIAHEIRNSKWVDDVEDNAKSDMYDVYLIATDADKFYGVPSVSL